MLCDISIMAGVAYNSNRCGHQSNLFKCDVPVDVCARSWSQSKDTSLKGHSDSVDQICWSPTHPNQLVSASGDKTVKVWDVRGGWGQTKFGLG